MLYAKETSVVRGSFVFTKVYKTLIVIFLFGFLYTCNNIQVDCDSKYSSIP